MQVFIQRINYLTTEPCNYKTIQPITQLEERGGGYKSIVQGEYNFHKWNVEQYTASDSEGMMANENQKKIHERPFLVFLIAFASLAAVLATLAMFDGNSLLIASSTYYVYGGMITGIIGFVFLNKGGTLKGGSDNQSLYRRNPEYFKKKRAEEKPLERIVWPVIFAGISIAVAGYLLGNFLVH